jgi:hypothetical protein
MKYPLPQLSGKDSSGLQSVAALLVGGDCVKVGLQQGTSPLEDLLNSDS